MLCESKGMDAVEEIGQCRHRVAEIAEEIGQQFPISFEETKMLLGDIRQRILKVRDHEVEAVRALESAMTGARQQPDHEHVAG